MKQWMICSLSAALLVGLMPVNAQEKKPDDKPKAPAEAPARPPGGGGGGGGGGRGGQGVDRLKMMTEELGLSKEQAAKLKVVLDAETKKTRELREDTALSQEDRRAKMTKIRQETAKKIEEEKILTEEQSKKWKEVQAQRRQRGGGQGGAGAGGGAGRPRRAPGSGTAPQ